MQMRSLQNQRYTGENRCTPCTVVNSAIAVLLSFLLSYVVSLISTDKFAAIMFIGANFVFGILIWLQGYLVPKTPELTKRYMPYWMLTSLKDDVHSTRIDVGEDLENFDVESFLLSWNVIELCEDDNDFVVSDDFKTIWDSEINNIPKEASSQIILSAFDINADNEKVIYDNDSLTVYIHEDLQLNWPSKTAMQIDVAGSRALKQYVPGWNQLDMLQKGRIVTGLRVFLKTCPDGGDVEIHQGVVESCCSTHDVVSIVCAESEEVLFEQIV